MNLQSIRIVLVATTHAGNIGSTARAMKTMGLEQLYLVAPKCVLNDQAFAMAAGAEDILHQAVVVDTLVDAIHPCQLVLGTSARQRDLALPELTPSEQAQMIASQPKATQIAILFGREHAGLTNEELLHCHYHIYIPTNPHYGSLNISQAVQIIAYEIRIKCLNNKNVLAVRSKEQRASGEEIALFYQHLHRVLIGIGFLKASNPKRLLHRLRRLFNRSQLEKSEVNILRGILTHMERQFNNKE